MGAAVAEPVLEARGLIKRFGGLTATDDVTLDVRTGELHALIGPNGAGKTTLIGQLTGELRPDAGQVFFRGEDITRLSTAARVKRGLVRSFQIVQLLDDDSALANVALAVQARLGHSFRFFRRAATDDALTAPARRILGDVGFDAARIDLRTGDLSHGERKVLELAVALAAEPQLLLLDEPMAGLGPSESLRMTDTLRALKGRIPILLIEHDMDAVFALADRISVLVYGRVIASGAPEAIRADPAVQEAYLAEEAG
jgi:branched-chain amino acid transport system ATP-binding protein